MTQDELIPLTFPARLEGAAADVIARPWDPEKECDHEETDDGSPLGGGDGGDDGDGAFPGSPAGSHGDPHLVTFDGLTYDVMTLGEFVLTRDPEGDLEVQTRHLPAGARAAWTSAVAVRAGEQRITFTAAELGDDVPIEVRVDGEVTEERELFLGAVHVSLSGFEDTEASAVITWPDGTTVRLWWGSSWFVDIVAAPDRAGRLVGLLGPGPDYNVLNDLRLPDGTIVDVEDAEVLDSEFSLAWAVDETTSLFDYDDGESPATFRIPHPDPLPFTPSAEALEQCARALGDEALRAEVEACAFDVSATGLESFLDAYVEVVEVREAVDAGDSLSEASGLDPIDSDATVRDTTTTPQTVAPAAEGVAGRPTLTLSADEPAGTVDAVAGAVLVIRAASCDSGPSHQTLAYFEVVNVEARTSTEGPLCGGGTVLSGDEWVDGEAYVWLRADDTYNVALSGDVAEIGAVDVFVDPTPQVVDAAAGGGGGGGVDRWTLSGIADTLVYLAEPGVDLVATGLDVACGQNAYSKPFPDSEPLAWYGTCEHPDGFFFGPYDDQVMPIVAFNRTGEDVTVGLAPRE